FPYPTLFRSVAARNTIAAELAGALVDAELVHAFLERHVDQGPREGPPRARRGVRTLQRLLLGQRGKARRRVVSGAQHFPGTVEIARETAVRQIGVNLA